MSEDVVRGWTPVYPHLRYECPHEAIAWLSRAFGLQERVRMARPDGSIITSKLETPGGGLVMVAGSSSDFKQWIRERIPNFREQQGQPWPNLSHTVTVEVGDVDAHYQRARDAGATILMPPTDHPWVCARTRPSISKAINGSSARRCASWSQRSGALVALSSNLSRQLFDCAPFSHAVQDHA